MSQLQVYLNSVGSITLDETKEFVRAGGQAKVYAQNGLAFKLLHEPSKIMQEQKMQELQLLDHPNIIRPIEFILSKARGEKIGFTMRYVQNYVTILKIFSNTFWRKRGFNAARATNLLESLRDSLAFVLSKNCLPTDPNPCNFLVKEDTLDRHALIDVDAWSTKSFPSRSVAPNVRDFTTSGFSEETLWYGFAVISCWLYLNVHPYMDGEHPKFGKDLEQRARNRASVFLPEVWRTLNNSAREQATIPANWREWLIAVLNEGQRMPPPQLAAPIIKPKITIVKISHAFEVKKLHAYPDPIIWHRHVNGYRLVKTEREFYKNDVALGGVCDDVVFAERLYARVVAQNEGIALYHQNGEDLGFFVKTSHWFTVENQLYALLPEGLAKIELLEMGKNLKATLKIVGKVSGASLQLFHGFLFQQIFSGNILYLPTEKSVNIRTLAPKPYRVIDGSRSGNTAMLSIESGGRIRQLFIAINSSGVVTEEEGEFELDYTVTSRGLVLRKHADRMIISNLKSSQTKIIQDEFMDPALVLSHEDDKVVAFKGNELYGLRLKQ